MRPHVKKYILAKERFIILLAILLFTLVIRLFLIDKIPGEWFGDISNVHEYEMQILSGKWPFYFFQSPGPLYHYLIAPIVLLYQNHGFETYKLASIVISLIGLIGTFLFVAEISSYRLSLITSLTMSFSFWYLVWSRLGNSQIVIPALVSLMSLFTARFVKKRKFKDLIFAAVIASLGWYTYPQTFIFPVVFLLFVIFYLIISHPGKRSASRMGFWTSQNDGFRLGLVIILMVIMVIPFINIIKADRGNFGSRGYVGEKVLPALNLPPDQLIKKTLLNWQKVFLMLHVKGDRTFRVNISGHPQLDAISGIFFLLGFLYFAKKKRMIWLFYILWMLFVLPLPSLSPAIPEIEIPSSARTIAVIPFVYLLVSAGILQSHEVILRATRHNFVDVGGESRSSRQARTIIGYIISIFFAGILSSIVFTNLKLYFVDYTRGLPDGNFASGKIIAKYIDRLPKDLNIYFGSCCWGEWGNPEPKAVAYVLRKPRDFIEYSHYLSSCKEVLKFPALVIFGPNDNTKEDEYKTCFPKFKKDEVKEENGKIVFTAIYVEKNQFQIPKTPR